jgi:ribosomal-protein-alanine N-acetyltransferase
MNDEPQSGPGGAAPLPESSRLYLRELTFEDTNALYGLLSDPLAMEWYPHTYTFAETRDWIERAHESYARFGHGFWAAAGKERGELIGICGVLNSEVRGTEEKALAWLILRRFWNQGYATEAGRALLDYGRRVLGRERIISLIRPGNVASIRVAIKLGMELEREVFWKGYVHGVWVRLAITDDTLVDHRI